jgi:thioredoxin-related protein
MIAVNRMPVASRPVDLSCKKLHIQLLRISSAMLMFAVSVTATVSATAADIVDAPRDPMEYFFHQSFNNLQEELENAVEEKKTGVFIMFSDKDCPWCLKMKTNIMNRVDVQTYYREHFRNMTIDIRGDTLMTDFDGNEVSEKDFAFKQHRVRATPVFMFFDTSGKVVMRLTGIVRDAKEFIWLGEFVVSGEYQNTNFTKYKRVREDQEKVISGNS